MLNFNPADVMMMPVGLSCKLGDGMKEQGRKEIKRIRKEMRRKDRIEKETKENERTDWRRKGRLRNKRKGKETGE